MTDTLELGKKRAEEIGLKAKSHYTNCYFGGTAGSGGGAGAGSGEQRYYDIADIHKLLGEGVETKHTTQMSLDLFKRLVELERALGLAIGGLEVVRLCPYDFNQDGVASVLEELKQIAASQREWMP